MRHNHYDKIKTQRWQAVASSLFVGIIAITLGALLGFTLVFFPPRAWIIIGAGGMLLIFVIQPANFLLGYLVAMPILDASITFFTSAASIGPQVLLRGGLIVLLGYYWLVTQRNPLVFKAALPMFMLLTLLVLSTFLSSGMTNLAQSSNPVKIAYWMLLLLTVADMVAHKAIKPPAIYRCVMFSILIMLGCVLLASSFGIDRGKYGIGEVTGTFSHHSLALCLSMGLIVTLAQALKQQNPLLLSLLLLFSGVIVISIARTYLRTSWIACITLLFVLNLMVWRYRKVEYLQGKILIWAQVIIAGIIAIFMLTHMEQLVERFSDFTDDEKIPGSGRAFIFLTALKNYANFSILKKVIGGGFLAARIHGNFLIALHNDYLSVLLAGGFVGIGLYLWLFISLWTQVKSTAGHSYFPFIIAGCAIATYLVAAMTGNTWVDVPVMTYFSFLVGGALGYYQLPPPGDESLS